MYKFLTIILGISLLFNLKNDIEFIKTPLEIKVFNEINNTRVSYGLKPLSYDENLSKLAREKAIDLSTSGIFSHTTDNYKSTRELLLKYPYPWIKGSENLLKGTSDPKKIANAFENSKEHLQNILNENYEKSGIGIFIDENGTPYLAQLFIDPLF